MMQMEELLARASWIAGPAFAYGEDDTGYYADYDAHADDAVRAPNRTHIVSKAFELTEAQLAAGVRLGIAVLGLARVKVNGRALPVELLGHWTRFDKLVYFDAFDLAGLVRPGANRIEVELGNGFYNPAPLTLFGKYNLRERLAEVGTPQVAAVVAAGDEPVAATDASWALARGQLRFNNLYLGEVRDLRLDLEAGKAVPAVVHGAPGSRALAPSPVPPQRRLGTVPARRIVDTPEGVLVDVGEMVAGTIDLAFTAGEGCRVEIVYAEVAEGDRIRTESNVAGLAGLATPRGVCPGGPGAPTPAVQRDLVICRAGENAYASTFTYHSFRYALIRGLRAADIARATAVYVHTDLARTGSLETGNPDLDRLLDAAVRAKLNNVHDIWEDCSRERFGYGGDMVSLMHSNLMLFDEEGLLDRTLADLERDQTARGGIPETAPFMGIGSNGPAYGEGPLLWQLAYPYLAVAADRYYGRRDLIERAWPGLVRFGDYLLSFDAEELAPHCLGDHGSILAGGAEGFKSGTPDKPFLGWCAILWNLRCIAEAGERIGRTAEAGCFAAAADGLRDEILKRFAHEGGSFGDGTQSACAFAGALGLGDPAQQAELLAADARARGGVLTTGIFGTMHAFDLLHRTGHDDVVEAWLLRREHPSLLAMLDAGSGALAEQFVEDLSSFDHAMFSSYAQWLFQALGGIRVADDARACDKIEVRPHFSRATDRVTCAYRTPRGEVRVAWRREGEAVRVRVEAPRGIELDTGDLASAEGVALEVVRV